jgi:hypothetical protein
MAKLTKALIVPEFGNGKINLYGPGLMPVGQPGYAVNMQAVLDNLFPGQGRTAAPNCCKLYGVDLFVTLSSADSQCIVKLPSYLSDPATAQAQAFIFTLDGDDYVGLAFDAAGNLYAAEGSFQDNMIVRYEGAGTVYPGPAAASGNNYPAGGKTTIGNAGSTSYFGDVAFDAAGNLWAADYLNHRVVAFDVGGLDITNTNRFHVLANEPGPLPVSNSDPALSGPTSYLFAEPEGLDFDTFGTIADLWISNNNDGGAGGVTNMLTTLVQITKSLQDVVLATANAGTVAAAAVVLNSNCFIYQVPNGAAGRPQFGGLQIDKAAKWLYVSEEVGGVVRAYDLATIAATPATPADSLLPITTTNPGNGGLALVTYGPQF